VKFGVWCLATTKEPDWLIGCFSRVSETIQQHWSLRDQTGQVSEREQSAVHGHGIRLHPDQLDGTTNVLRALDNAVRRKTTETASLLQFFTSNHARA